MCRITLRESARKEQKEMIKITAILIVACVLNSIGMRMYLCVLPKSDIIRIELKQFKLFERIWFMISGWLIISTPICVAISVVILIFRYL